MNEIFEWFLCLNILKANELVLPQAVKWLNTSEWMTDWTLWMILVYKYA